MTSPSFPRSLWPLLAHSEIHAQMHPSSIAVMHVAVCCHRPLSLAVSQPQPPSIGLAIPCHLARSLFSQRHRPCVPRIAPCVIQPLLFLPPGRFSAPCLVLQVREGRPVQSSTKAGSLNPEWNEEFHLIVDDRKLQALTITVKEDDFGW